VHLVGYFYDCIAMHGIMNVYFNFSFSGYSLNNVIQFMMSRTIPNEICHNDTYKVLNGLRQTKPWALRSRYLLHGCGTAMFLFYFVPRRKQSKNILLSSQSASTILLHGLEIKFISSTSFPLLFNIHLFFLLHFLISGKPRFPLTRTSRFPDRTIVLSGPRIANRVDSSALNDR
jgi:hypothetical protein